MKILALAVVLFPLIVFSQAVERQISKAETELAVINKKEDSLLQVIEGLKFQKLREDLRATGLPKYDSTEDIVFHTAYALVYSEAYEQAKWVAHIILPDVKTGNEGRTNDFRPDSSIKTGSAVEADYFTRQVQPDNSIKYDGFGYDRGHLAPSADFRYSKKALSESYFYSNMSPQVAQLNRGRWAELEDVIRQYAIRNNRQVYVVSGGVLKPGLKKIEKGMNKISIPEYYFKVALDLTGKRGIGFRCPTRPANTR